MKHKAQQSLFNLYSSRQWRENHWFGVYQSIWHSWLPHWRALLCNCGRADGLFLRCLFMSRCLAKEGRAVCFIDTIIIKISQSESVSHYNPLELRHELWELTEPYREAPASALITHHMSERHSATSFITPTWSMQVFRQLSLLCQSAQTALNQSEVRWFFNTAPHLSAKIKSPNKSTMIKDLLSSSLSAHKVEQ